MIEARIVVIRPAQHHDADAVFALQLVEHLPGTPANTRFVARERIEADFDGTVVLFL